MKWVTLEKGEKLGFKAILDKKEKKGQKEEMEWMVHSGKRAYLVNLDLGYVHVNI